MNLVNRIFQNDYFIIISLYSISFGLLAINSGVFWDGWVVYNVNSESLYRFSTEIGDMWYHQIYIYLLQLNQGLLLLRLITFFSYLFSALFLYKILKEFKGIQTFQVLILVLLFALFPVNHSRITIAITKYAICHFSFFMGFWALVKYYKTKDIILRISAIVLFFLSFDTSSLLVFYLIPLLFIVYQNRKVISTFDSICKKILYHADFLIIPILYFAIKQLFFRSFGVYENYNSISLQNVLLSPLNSIGTFYSSFVMPINDALLNGWIVVLIGFLIYYLIKNKNREQTSPSGHLILFGFFAFFLAVFPYLAVGRSGIGFGLEWQSRDQLLIPLGAAFILYYSTLLILRHFEINPKIQNLVFSMLISAFVISNIINSLEFQRDWFKQQSLIENFKSSVILKNNTCFLFEDNTLNLNAINRTYRFYEYTGLMKHSFGSDNRFGEAIASFEKNDKEINYYLPFKPRLHYNFGSFEIINPEYKVIINPGSFDLSLKNTVKLMLYKFINRNKFDDKIQNIVRLDYIVL